MSEKVAHWATAASAVVATIALVVSLCKFWNDKEQAQVEQWQEVAVYEYILNNTSSTFQEIKIGYVTEAQQIQTFSIPKEQIQDDTLRKILLKLQSNNLIRLLKIGGYEAVLSEKQPGNAELMNVLYKQQHMRDLYPLVKSKVIDILDVECGQLNQGQLFRRVSETIKVEPHIFSDMLHGMRGIEVHKLEDATWCTTYDSEKLED